MATRAQLLQRRRELRDQIRDLKIESRDNEPDIQAIVRYIMENHPGKQHQRVIEGQIRAAQTELSDINDQLDQLRIR